MIDPTVFNTIIEAVTGGEPVRKAMAALNVNPNTFYRHLAADEEADKRYARAKYAAVEAMADELLDIADASEGDAIIDEDGRRVIDNEAVQRARLRVDTRKWLLSKLVPKKYGDKQEVAVTGGLNIVAVHGTDSSLV